MSVVNIASSRTLSDGGPDHLAELAVSLSSRLTRVVADGMAAALAESLAEIAVALRVDGCRYSLRSCGHLPGIASRSRAIGRGEFVSRSPAQRLGLGRPHDVI